MLRISNAILDITCADYASPSRAQMIYIQQHKLRNADVHNNAYLSLSPDNTFVCRLENVSCRIEHFPLCFLSDKHTLAKLSYF